MTEGIKKTLKVHVFKFGGGGICTLRSGVSRGGPETTVFTGFIGFTWSCKAFGWAESGETNRFGPPPSRLPPCR